MAAAACQFRGCSHASLIMLPRLEFAWQASNYL
jgi:hypothetical protein